MKKNAIAVLLLMIIYSTGAISADYIGFQHEYFLEQHPSAKANAMGHGMTALSDGAFSAYYNPAGIIANAGFSAAYSEISPYYFIDDARYSYFGLTQEWGNWGTIGLSQYKFDAKAGGYTDESGSPQTMTLSMNTLTLSQNVFWDLALGLNFNLYYYKDFYAQDHFSFPVDVGLLKSFLIKSETSPQKFTLGMVVKNVLASTIDDAGLGDVAVLPVTFRAGAGWETILMNQEVITGLLLLGMETNIEYENILNTSNHSAYKAGTQLSLLELFFVRLGYYSYSFDPELGGKDSFSDFTWGLGVQVYLDDFVERHFPLYLRLDYAQLTPPTYKTGLEDKTNMTLGVQLQWMFDDE